jgi:hypothetical protein
VVGGTEYKLNLLPEGGFNPGRDGGGLFRYIVAGSSDDPLGQYYLGINAFGDTGFAEMYRDRSNQVRHFLGGSVAGGKAYGGIARLELINRETDQAERNVHWAGFRMVDALNTQKMTIFETGRWALTNLASASLKREYGLVTYGGQ